MVKPKFRGASTLLALGFVFLGLAILGSGWLVEWQQRGAFWVSRTLQVEHGLETILSKLQDEEAGSQAYLLTRDPDAIGRVERARAEIPGKLDGLSKLIQRSPRQVNATRTLGQLTLHLEATLSAIRAVAPNSTASQILAAQRQMAAIHRQIDSMVAEEDRLLSLRQAHAAQFLLWARMARTACVFVTIGLGWMVYRDTRKRLADVIAVRDDLARTVSLLEAESLTREGAEAEVRQLQKMEAIGQLTGGIAHDFNNMLAVVVGSLELAKRRITQAPERAFSAIENAEEAASRAAQLTARLLAFARKQPLAPQPLDANTLVNGMSELLRRTIGEQIRVETLLAIGPWRANVDPAQLENAILNLCVNARDAMPDGGTLTIETSNGHMDDAYSIAHPNVEAGQYVVVSVTDTGAGMAPEVIERAFEPFYTTKSVGKGTGLGLSQVHGFVRQSGGHVNIKSEVGQGTTVKLCLPRYFGPDLSVVSPQIYDEIVRAREGETVLVVEDEGLVRRMSVNALRELGYTVMQAADAKEALEMLRLQPRVDLLFTDIVMPEMNGRQLVELALQARPSMPVLYTTGYSRDAVIHNGVHDDGVALLPKPFTLVQLANKVRQVLDGDGANRSGGEGV